MSGKEHFVCTFAGGEDKAYADDEQIILRSIGAVSDRDTMKYLFVCCYIFISCVKYIATNGNTSTL